MCNGAQDISRTDSRENLKIHVQNYRGCWPIDDACGDKLRTKIILADIIPRDPCFLI